jgi:tetratricopeptide (TPR) repeat protein
LITSPELRLRIYLALGYDYLLLARYQEAMDFYEQAMNMAGGFEDLASEGAIYWQLGQSSKDARDLARARMHLDKALVTFELRENIRLSAQLRSLFGRIFVNLERYPEAEGQFTESLGLAEQMGDVFIQGNILCNLAMLHNARGDYDRAIAAAGEGLEVAQVSREQRTEGQLHVALAIAYEARDDLAAAEQELEQAITISEQIGDKHLLGHAHERYGSLLANLGRFQEAYEQMRAARAALPRKDADL